MQLAIAQMASQLNQDAKADRERTLAALQSLHEAATATGDVNRKAIASFELRLQNLEREVEGLRSAALSPPPSRSRQTTAVSAAGSSGPWSQSAPLRASAGARSTAAATDVAASTRSSTVGFEPGS